MLGPHALRGVDVRDAAPVAYPVPLVAARITLSLYRCAVKRYSNMLVCPPKRNRPEDTRADVAPSERLGLGPV